jgi:serine/threonine protein kinase
MDRWHRARMLSAFARHSRCRSASDASSALQIKLQHLLKTLLEVAYAMRHLHNMHILHRDLKIQNILLKSSNKDSRGFTVKVSDFGLAKIWDGRGGQGTSPTDRQKYAGARPARASAGVRSCSRCQLARSSASVPRVA